LEAAAEPTVSLAEPTVEQAAARSAPVEAKPSAAELAPSAGVQEARPLSRQSVEAPSSPGLTPLACTPREDVAVEVEDTLMNGGAFDEEEESMINPRLRDLTIRLKIQISATCEAEQLEEQAALASVAARQGREQELTAAHAVPRSPGSAPVINHVVVEAETEDVGAAIAASDALAPSEEENEAEPTAVAEEPTAVAEEPTPDVGEPTPNVEEPTPDVEEPAPEAAKLAVEAEELTALAEEPAPEAAQVETMVPDEQEQVASVEDSVARTPPDAVLGEMTTVHPSEEGSEAPDCGAVDVQGAGPVGAILSPAEEQAGVQTADGRVALYTEGANASEHDEEKESIPAEAGLPALAVDSLTPAEDRDLVPEASAADAEVPEAEMVETPPPHIEDQGTVMPVPIVAQPPLTGLGPVAAEQAPSEDIVLAEPAIDIPAEPKPAHEIVQKKGARFYDAFKRGKRAPKPTRTRQFFAEAEKEVPDPVQVTVVFSPGRVPVASPPTSQRRVLEESEPERVETPAIQDGRVMPGPLSSRRGEVASKAPAAEGAAPPVSEFAEVPSSQATQALPEDGAVRDAVLPPAAGAPDQQPGQEPSAAPPSVRAEEPHCAREEPSSDPSPADNVPAVQQMAPESHLQAEQSPAPPAAGPAVMAPTAQVPAGMAAVQQHVSSVRMTNSRDGTRSQRQSDNAAVSDRSLDRESPHQPRVLPPVQAPVRGILDGSGYAGKRVNGEFQKNTATSLAGLSPVELEAVSADIAREREEKAQLLEEKQRARQTEQKKKQMDAKAAVQDQVDEMQRLTDMRKAEKVESIKKWLRDKEAQRRQQLEKERQKLEEFESRQSAKEMKKKFLVEERIAERDRRIRSATRKKEIAQQQLAEYDPSAALMSSGPAKVNDRKRVMHRHVHHHIHYHHDDEDEDQEVHQYGLDDEERRRIEMESEHAAGPMVDGGGGVGLSASASAPMLLPPVGNRFGGVLAAEGPKKYATGVHRAFGAYQDSGRPVYPGSQVSRTPARANAWS